SFLSFFRVPRPPCPPLFPYTTLFRSRLRALDVGLEDRSEHGEVTVDRLDQRVRLLRVVGHQAQRVGQRLLLVDVGAVPVEDVLRSEEHTSELQSRENLVCRLLLEKKK